MITGKTNASRKLNTGPAATTAILPHTGEHTAALDPKTSVALMKLTDEFVTRDHLTALMITHHMEDALKYGNRLIVMKDGQIIKDLTKEEKDQLDITDYYAMFE